MKKSKTARPAVRKKTYQIDDMMQDGRQAAIKALSALKVKKNAPEILFDGGPDMEQYNEQRKVFNRRFKYKPFCIARCETTEQVQEIVRIASATSIGITVRSGGHDHEGECMGTDIIAIDLSKMNKIEFEYDNQVLKVQPAARFNELTAALIEADVCIPHGTCGTVAVGGFSMGGGWGPWTRRHGMCCEHVIGATIVLGNGERQDIKEGDELLWAIKGGGGLSYGIVTELRIETFPMPVDAIKFSIEWDNRPGLEVLRIWESVISDVSERTYPLIGTNLKIMANPKAWDEYHDIETSIHICTFYGYFQGTEQHLKEWLAENFAPLPTDDIYIFPNPTPRNNNKLGAHMAGFGGWDRVIPKREQLKYQTPVLEAIAPDQDAPAPHKISSQLVKNNVDREERQKALIRSLESDLVSYDGIMAGISCYVTLGAISGHYYANYHERPYPYGSSFPYKDRLYTVQYQVWWNADPASIEKGKEHDVNRYTNYAMDWINYARRINTPYTSGSFISFKDNNVPVMEYFQQHFDQLKRIKDKYSEDPKNMLSSRTTIR